MPARFESYLPYIRRNQVQGMCQGKCICLVVRLANVFDWCSLLLLWRALNSTFFLLAVSQVSPSARPSVKSSRFQFQYEQDHALRREKVMVLFINTWSTDTPTSLESFLTLHACTLRHAMPAPPPLPSLPLCVQAELGCLFVISSCESATQRR